jgi:hypothetical protein
MNIKIGFSHLSKHGLRRLQERTAFNTKELLRLLDTNSFLSLGVEVGFNREHCLVYSSSKNEYFVAVQDQKMGTVVTVLTVGYHQTLSWRLVKRYEKIDDEILRRVRLLACYNFGNEELKLNIKLKALFIDRDGKRKTTTIKKYKASAYAFQPGQMIAKEQRVNNLVSRWLKGVSIDEIIDIYSIMGRSGLPCFASELLVENLNNKVSSTNFKDFTKLI